MNNIVDVLKEEFCYSEISNLRLVHEGFTKGYSFISEGGMKYLKIYPDRYFDAKDNKKLYSSVFKIRNSFHINGIPMLMPLKNKSGKFFFRINSNYSEIYDYIIYQNPKINYKSIVNVANILANMHSIKTKIESFRTFQKIIKIINDITKFLPKESRANVRNHVRDVIKSMNDLKCVNCHGDYHFKNFILINNNIYIDDFDSIIYAPRIYDVAVMLCFLMESKRKSKYFSLFLKTYHQNDKLSLYEKKLLPSMIIIHRLEQLVGTVTNGRKEDFKKSFNILKIILNNIRQIREKIKCI